MPSCQELFTPITVFVCLCLDTSITLSRVRRTDTGVYQCIAVNVVSSAYATALLTVKSDTGNMTTQPLADDNSRVASPSPSGMYQLLRFIA